VVAGQQAYSLRPVPGDEIVELLVGQCLDRSRVEALGAIAKREMYGELPDYGLARTSRRSDQNAVATFECRARALLEVIERKRVAGQEVLEDRSCPAP